MRKHKEVIEAWLEGRDIQYKAPHTCNWEDYEEDFLSNPMNAKELDWRVKPEELQTFAYHIPYPRINEVEIIGVEKGNGVLIIKYKLKE